jgi:hypothetical protein
VSSGLSQYSGLIVDTGTNNNTFLAWDAELWDGLNIKS